jgi:hypothetical protein
MKTISKMRTVKFFRKAARRFVADLAEISKYTNYPIYCSRFYNPYMM